VSKRREYWHENAHIVRNRVGIEVWELRLHRVASWRLYLVFNTILEVGPMGKHAAYLLKLGRIFPNHSSASSPCRAAPGLPVRRKS
jgi:hypothetical protein